MKLKSLFDPKVIVSGALATILAGFLMYQFRGRISFLKGASRGFDTGV